MAVERDADTLRRHITASYTHLRLGIGVIALALPLVLVIGDRELRPSMSDYYYTAMRDAFVGAVIAIGVFLYLYKGFSTRENWALNIAGILAVFVAILPTEAPGEASNVRSTVHIASAVIFFLAIAYVCIFRASDTLSLIRDTRDAEKYALTYKLFGIGMIVSPFLALVLAFTIGQSALIFFVETLAVWIFAAFWIVKSVELRRTDAEQLALQGKLQAAPETDAPKEAPGRLMQVAE
jgi:hypothetical protein